MEYPKRLVDAVRQLVDGALDRVFDAPFDVRDAEDVRRVVMSGGGSGHLNARRLSTLVAAATPVAERLVKVARRTTSVASKAPSPQAKAARYAVAALPVGAQLVSVARLGIRELQALASYVIFRLRVAGVEPERALVRRITLTLYLDPSRRPDARVSPGRAAGAIARRWVTRAVTPDSDATVTARLAAQTAALERLDLAAIASLRT